MRNDEHPTLASVIGGNLRRIREAKGLSRDQAARLVRINGLPWSRAAVAAAERGTKTFDVDELVLLALALHTSIKEILAGTGRARVGGATPELEVVRVVLAGGKADEELREELTVEQLGLEDQVSDLLHDYGQQVGKNMKLYQRKWKRFAPGVDNPNYAIVSKVDQDARGEAEQKAARRLGVDASDLAIAAYGLWHRSLTEVRDERVSQQASPDAPPRTMQALRGHVTRQLLDELEPILKKGLTRGKH